MRAKRKLDHGPSPFSKRKRGPRSKFKKCSIEDHFLRFPHLSESIFNQLDDETLADCRKINKIWLNFIDNERFLWVRMIKKKIGHISSLLNVPGPLSRKQTKMSKFQEHWKNVFNKTPLMIIKDLAFSVKKCHQEVYRGETPLHFIAFKGNLDSYKFFCQNKVDKNPKCDKGITPLHYAAEAGNTEIVKYILKNVSDKLPKSKSNGRTPLHSAVISGQFKTFKIIADQVEDENPADNNGETPLSLAVELGHLDICKYILAIVRNKNPKDSKGWTLLHFAAEFGHYEIYEEIVESVEDKNPANSDGWTPLHLAVDKGHFEICKYIIENTLHTYSRNPPIQITRGPLWNEVGMTALDIAAQNGHLRIYKLISKYLEDINPPGKRKLTPLHYAVRARRFKVCKYIIQNVKDKHPKDIWFQTPLQWAMEHDYSKVVKLYEKMDKKVYKKISDTYIGT